MRRAGRPSRMDHASGMAKIMKAAMHAPLSPTLSRKRARWQTTRYAKFIFHVPKQCGFSLVELMITILIISVLSMIAIPSYGSWIQNQQIRTAAESILNGIQMARSEAVKNNGQARFVLCGLPASSWEIRAASSIAAANAVASPVCGTTVPAGEIRAQERSGQEGSRLAQVAVNGGAIGVTTITTVTFNSFGRVVTPNADGSAPITQVGVTTPTGTRPLQVRVSTGGSTRMCDPSPLLPVTDPRHC